MATPKEAARQLIDHLPDQVTWNDMYELYVRQKIEAGLNPEALRRAQKQREEIKSTKDKLEANLEAAWESALSAAASRGHTAGSPR